MRACDTVLVLYDGTVKRTLRGPDITERALISLALNIDSVADEARRHAPAGA